MDKNSITQLIEEINDCLVNGGDSDINPETIPAIIELILSKQKLYYSDYFQKWIVDEGSHNYHQIAILKDGDEFSYEAVMKDGGAKSVIIETGFESPDQALRVAKQRIDGDWA